MKKQLAILILIMTSGLSLTAQNSSNQSFSGNSDSDSVVVELQGNIKNRAGDVLVIAYSDNINLPAKNIKGTLSKYFDSVVFGFKTTGWLEIADVQVMSCENGIMKLKILSEKSQMTINQEQVNHFKPGNQVKMIWKEILK